MVSQFAKNVNYKIQYTKRYFLINNKNSMNNEPILEQNIEMVNNGQENISDNDSEYSEGNETYSDSANSLGSDIDSIDLNSNQFSVQRVKHNRNRPRMNNGRHIGALAFDIVWEDDSVTREPIQNLIDKDSESVNEYIIDIINDYKKTARDYPRNYRFCLMCYHKVHNGDFICSKHTLMYPFLND